MHRVCSQLVISFQILSPSQRKKFNEFRIFEILIKNIFLFVRKKYSDVRFDAFGGSTVVYWLSSSYSIFFFRMNHRFYTYIYSL